MAVQGSPPSGRPTLDRHRVGLIAGPLAAAAVLAFVDLDPGRPEVTRTAAVAVLVATWWITEAIPLFATSLVPLVAFPLLGILPGGKVAPAYVNSTIFLFIGGFLIALAMERWGLHRRIALNIIARAGSSPSRVIVGFMLASALLSMWISNTATAVMMTPIALAILGPLEEREGRERIRPLATALLLGIAYACSIGGLSTLVGTPPNLSFVRIYDIQFPGAPEIGFGRWLLVGLPVALVMFGVIAFLLTRVFFRCPPDLRIDPDEIRARRDALGPATFEEKAVLAVFATTAILWVFRVPLEVGPIRIPGWSSLVPTSGFLDDGTVAIGMALVLFLIPARRRAPEPGGEGESEEPRARVSGTGTEPARFGGIADAGIVLRLPWGVVLLFGGGFALATGFSETGLSKVLGNHFEGLGVLPPFVLVLSICLGITFLTELTSNVATTETILPILAGVSVAVGVHPLVLMVPATLSASCAFMMPVATPPNAIVFGSGRLAVPDMARAGIWINLLGAVVIASAFQLLGPAVLGTDGPAPAPAPVPGSEVGALEADGVPARPSHLESDQ